MKVVLMKVVFDENFFDEIDHFHPNFDESVPNRRKIRKYLVHVFNDFFLGQKL